MRTPRFVGGVALAALGVLLAGFELLGPEVGLAGELVSDGMTASSTAASTGSGTTGSVARRTDAVSLVEQASVVVWRRPPDEVSTGNRLTAR